MLVQCLTMTRAVLEKVSPSPPSKFSHQGSDPLISIITPVYNAERFLFDTLESIRHQRYPHWELILVDDGSTDASAEIISSWMQRHPKLNVRYVRQENQGVSVARNHGFSLSQGEYVSFLDADDVWFPDKLSADVQTIRRHGQPECLIYSAYYVVNERYQLTNLPRHLPITPGDFRSVVGCNIFPSIALMHRNIFQKLNGFLDNRICSQEDRVFFVKACVYFPAFGTQQRQVIYRQLNSGRALNQLENLDRMIHDEYSTINALRDDLNDADFELFKNHHVRSLMNRFLRFKAFDNAKRYAMMVPVGLLIKDPKGLLTILSLCLNMNLIDTVQDTQKFFLQTILAPWWQLKKNQLALGTSPNF